MIHRIGNPLILPRNVVAGSTLTMKADALLWMDKANNVVKPASAFTWDTSEAITARKFASRFCGISAGAQIATDPARSVPVLNAGEFEFPCASGAYKANSLLRAKKDASANLLDDFYVAATTGWNDAIAMVSRDHPAGSTSVRAFILNRFVMGQFGFNPQAQIHELSIYIRDTNTAGYVVGENSASAGYQFGRRIALVSASFFTATAIGTTNEILTINKNNVANAQTFTLPTATLTALGKTVSQTFDPSAADCQYEADDYLGIQNDGGSSAGAGTLVLRFIDLPGATH